MIYLNVNNHRWCVTIKKNIDEPLTESKAKEIVIQKKTSGISFRKLASKQGISKSSIHSLFKRIVLMDPSNCTLQRSCHNRQDFTTHQEAELAFRLSCCCSTVESWPHFSKHEKTCI